MRDEEKAILEQESAIGSKAELAYNGFLKPFIMKKRQDLFNNFCDASISDVEVLLEAKRLVKVIDQMEEEVLIVIETGKLARISLGEQDEN